MKNKFFAILVLFLLLILGTTTYAQSVDVQRVGIDPGKRVDMTLHDVILIALENNRDIEVERLNVQMNQFDLLSAHGAYDPTFTTSLFYDRRNFPSTSIFTGTKTDSLMGNALVNQKLPWQGGNLQLNFDNNRGTTDNLFNNFNPQFTTNLGVTYTQPLWRNRGTDSSRRQINITKKRLNLSDSQFRQRAIEIIAQVQRSYWDLVFARRDYQIKKESVDLARTQLEHNERLVSAGSLAPADIISAKVELERRIDETEAAVDVIQRAENSLKSLMLTPEKIEMWQSELVPVDSPQVDVNAKLPLNDAVKMAYSSRPEMEQYKLRSEINSIDTQFYQDQAKPQIDFFTTYSMNGLSGNLREGANPISTMNSGLYEWLNKLDRPAGLGPYVPASGGTIPDFLRGGYGLSLSNMFSNDFRTVKVGVNINLPIRNRTAQGNLGRSLAEGKRILTEKQKVEQLIEIEVRNALQAVATASRRVEATKNSRINAELQYDSEQRKFDAGQSTNFFVLDRQNALSSARGRELRALTDYTKAVAELQRATSTTLTSNNVNVAIK